ncbi:uncharacterized protein LOC123425760 isoform X1 [Hordeum vulgare subsp. vulgare]|uniref:uncharacterized protein LOC123425760 isoform X1 n=1 Tax=Hordeum vulgare subsp. vulgare TaxID=112509 RepID=UPI00162C427E|nr:uncharacterized protein LOC123425760 isoform X1 [Hordeum vulgare subsp. vulgare]XP_044965411.1 uncharacterized protein LOC123425760 isoform X1 [Hordeum vulgare subsp. vulgare]XP_044965412.1 uncharacterized protein LOC123425760 isoform X1 [Hordeum vulgare subsp. vulgare]XP_044965413.1 uncharacterized protein LOC123425760 isoform X1 [Hordeum vulgare subsp. vulgare]XP_044965414.1 uncharacterized protein LOC123425760 isoform X1 [Hordeum vulgare subsp. vulgare]XP_044965415.1 uncharacterized prot
MLYNFPSERLKAHEVLPEWLLAPLEGIRRQDNLQLSTHHDVAMDLINSVTGVDEEGCSRQRILTFAAKRYISAIERNPEDPDAYYNWALVLQESADNVDPNSDSSKDSLLEEACKKYAEATRLCPTQYDSKHHRKSTDTQWWVLLALYSASARQQSTIILFKLARLLDDGRGNIFYLLNLEVLTRRENGARATWRPELWRARGRGGRSSPIRVGGHHGLEGGSVERIDEGERWCSPARKVVGWWWRKNWQGRRGGDRGRRWRPEVAGGDGGRR